MTNQIKTVFLLALLSAVLIGIGGMIGKGGLYVAGFIAILMNFGSYFFSEKIVLAMSRAQEAPEAQFPNLHRIVAELAQSAGIPKPRVYIMPEPQPNAFATGRNPSKGVVAVTTGLMEMLGERELRGVIAHELAHIKNRDILVATIAASIASMIAFIGNTLQWAAMFGMGRSDDDDEGSGSIVGALAMAIVAPLAASLIQMAISRSREFLADARGAEIAGDSNGLASALEKLQFASERLPADVQPATASLYIVNPLSGRRSMMSWFSTHPPIEERVAKLRQMQVAVGGPVVRYA